MHTRQSLQQECLCTEFTGNLCFNIFLTDGKWEVSHELYWFAVLPEILVTYLWIAKLSQDIFSRPCAKTTFREDGENYCRFRCCSYLLMEGLVLSQVEALLSVPTVVRELTKFLRIKSFFSISHDTVIPKTLPLFLHPSLARTNLFYPWESDLHLMHSRPLLSPFEYIFFGAHPC